MSGKTTAILCSAAVALAAASAAESKTAANVSVTESEMNISASTVRAPAGKVTFVVRNGGTVAHELVIVRWTGTKLPMQRWKVIEAKIKVGEVPELEPGKVGRVTLSLTPGTYLMICNIPGHYELGMARPLTVA